MKNLNYKRAAIFAALAACLVGARWRYMDQDDQLDAARHHEAQLSQYIQTAAQPAPASLSSVKVNGITAGERIVNLPEDGQNWYTIIITSPNWQRDTREASFVNGFDRNPRLMSLKRQTHFVHYTTDNPLYVARFAPSIVNRVPAVVVEKADGQIVSKFLGDGMPRDWDVLAEGIAADVNEYRGGGDCPDCRPFHPKPSPTPAPSPAPAPPAPTPIPDLGPVDKPHNDFPWGILALAVGGALFLGLKANIGKTLGSRF